MAQHQSSLSERITSRLPATRHRDFRALWGGTASSSISLWTLLLGNAWIVYELSNSSFWVGVSTFASMSPYLLAPFGGIVADKFERRILVRLTRLGAFAVTMTLFFLALTDIIEVWMVVGMALVQGLVRAVEIPSDQALLANVVPPEDLANAVALSSTTQYGARAVGPVLAGPLLATVGVAGAYAVGGLFALLAFTSIRRIETRSRGGVGSLGEVVESLREGLSYVRVTTPVLALFLLVVAHCSLTMSFDAMLPGFAETELHSPSGGFTLMTMGVGVGALVGTFALSMFPGGRRGRLFLWVGVASGLSPVLMAHSHNVPIAVVNTILMGSSQAMFMALSAVFLQEVVPDAVRGRVMSLYLMSAGGIMAMANLAFGSLADAWGAPMLFMAPGAAFTVIIVLASFSVPHLRRVFQTGAVMPAPA
ncbi:MAG: MFS transporter [Dehalococcoidia bacterium]|nr:MFS transporter [Dehalococcoidia bacterium]